MYAIKRNNQHYVEKYGPYGVTLSNGAVTKFTRDEAAEVCANLNARGIGKFEVVEVK